MGIKHFEELPVDQILTVLENHNWRFSEKRDGSFLRFGLDDQGNFYTERYPGDRYHRVEEWPFMPWTNSFRSAHDALHAMIAVLRDEDLIRAGEHYDVELMWGRTPNAITYRYHHMERIVVVSYPERLANAKPMYADSKWEQMFVLTSITVNTPTWIVDSNNNLAITEHASDWSFSFNQEYEKSIRDEPTVAAIKMFLADICTDVGVSYYRLLATKLNSRPDFIEDSDWKANRVQIISNLKSLRSAADQMLRVLLKDAKKDLLEMLCRIYQEEANQQIEGFVAETKGIQFKLVYDNFKRANRFVHWVRYALQGGSRPPKPSFLTRTAHWPIEKRIERLHKLRERYMWWSTTIPVLQYAFPYSHGYSDKEINERTLLLFAELEVRIKNGWDSVQGSSPQGDTGGDPVDPALATFEDPGPSGISS